MGCKTVHTTQYFSIGMRFRSKLLKEGLLQFQGVLLVMEKNGNSIVICFNEDCLRLAVVTDSIITPKVFAELSQRAIFIDYRIESQSGNLILIEIEISLLIKALNSGKQAPLSQLKLVKRGNHPCLCFESRVDLKQLRIFFNAVNRPKMLSK
jgi:hypothetical protein